MLQSNGIAKKRNWTLVEMAKCMTNVKRILKSNPCSYMINWSPTSILPFKVLHGWNPKVTHFRIFCCIVHIHIPSKKKKREKLDYNSLKCILIRHNVDIKGYKFYDPLVKKLLISHDAIFL